MAADGDVRSLGNNRRGQDEDRGVPGRSWAARREEKIRKTGPCGSSCDQPGELEIKLLFWEKKEVETLKCGETACFWSPVGWDRWCSVVSQQLSIMGRGQIRETHN